MALLQQLLRLATLVETYKENSRALFDSFWQYLFLNSCISFSERNFFSVLNHLYFILFRVVFFFFFFFYFLFVYFCPHVFVVAKKWTGKWRKRIKEISFLRMASIIPNSKEMQKGFILCVFLLNCMIEHHIFLTEDEGVCKWKWKSLYIYVE